MSQAISSGSNRARKIAVAIVCACVALALICVLRGCALDANPLDANPIDGGKYCWKAIGANSLLHNPGYLKLYYINDAGFRNELWPRPFFAFVCTGSLYAPDVRVNRQREMLIFSGGLSDDPIWRSEPALLVHDYATGVVYEISHAVTIMALEGSIKLSHQHQWPIVEDGSMDDANTYYYEYPEGFHSTVKMISSARSQKREGCFVYLTRDDVIRAIEETKRNGHERSYLGFKYIIDPDSVVKARLDAEK